MTTYLALILLLPLVGAVINAVAGRALPRRAVETLACGVVWGSFVCAVLAFVSYTGPVKVELLSWLASFDLQAPVNLYVDPLSLVMVLMITFVCGLIHVYSVAYMADDAGYVRFFFLLNLFVFAMLVLVLAENLPLLYLGWEGVGFCSYALIGFWYRDANNATAGRKAFIVTRIGDVGLAIAIVWIFRLFGTVSITEVNGMGFLMPGGVITALGLLLLIGAMGKSAQMPLMVWLPDAMAGPTPVSALIHAATMVTAGVYLLARMHPLIGASPVALAAIAITGGVTAFYAATCALAQRDLKRALAYSTISQIGFMILGIGAGAIPAATFHLLVHAFFKSLLFLGAGCIIAAMHHEQDMFRMGGLAKSLPLTFWSFLAGAACLAGLPLTGGFFSKDSILAAVWLKGGGLYLALFLLGMATALLTSVYTFRMVYLVFGGGRRKPHPVPRIMETVLIPLALLGLCGGLLNLPGYLGGGWLERLLAGFPARTAEAQEHTVELALQAAAATVALAGLVIAYLRYGGTRRQERVAEAAAGPAGPVELFFLNGWRFDDLYRILFVTPYKTLARFFWEKVDEGVIDDSLDRLAGLLGSIGHGLTAWTTGQGLDVPGEPGGRACADTRVPRVGDSMTGLRFTDHAQQRNRDILMPADSLLTILVFLPLAGALCLFPIRQRKGWVKSAAVAAAVLELVLAAAAAVTSPTAQVQGAPGAFFLWQDAPWIERFGIRYTLGMDGISLLMVLLTAFLTLIALLVSWKAVTERITLFYALILVMETGIMGVFLSLDLILFYLFWEVMLVPMFLLIGIWGHGRRIYTAVKFFLYTLAGSLLMLLAIIGVYLIHGAQSGTYTFALPALAATPMTLQTASWLYAAFLLAFAIKVPLFPVHTWLPDAHTDAPTAGSVVLAGLLLKTGAYGIIRFGYPLFPQAAAAFTPVLSLLAVIGIVYGSWVAFAQTDMKRLVAYSSVGHMGFVALGIAAWTPVSLSGSVFQMVNHGITTGALFALVGMLDERAATRDIDAFGGLWGKIPLFSAFFLLFSMASAGLPGLNNFAGEFIILAGSFRALPLAAVLALIGIIFPLVYTIRLVQELLFGTERRALPLPDLSVREGGVLALLALFVVYLGLHPAPLLELVKLPVSLLTSAKGGMP